MSSNVVGRAVVRIDGEVDSSSTQSAADEFERIMGSSGEAAAAEIEQSFSQIAFPRELGGFNESLDAIAGTGREVGGGFGDLVTAMDTFGVTATEQGAAVAEAFEKIEAASQVFGGVSDIINGGKAAFTALSSATNITAGAQAALNAVMALNPIFLVVAAIAALVAGLVIAYQRSETFRAIVDKAFNAIRNVVTTAIEAVRTVISTVFGWIRTYFTTVFNVYRTIITTAFNVIRTVITTVVNTVRSVVTSVFNTVRTVVTTAVNTVKRVVTSAFNAVRTKTVEVFNRVKDIVTGVVDDVVGAVTGIKDKVVSAVSGFGTLLVDAGEDLVRGIWDGITGMGTWLFDKVTGFVADNLPGPVARALGISSPSKVMADLARWVPIGMAQGIEDNLGPLRAAATAMADAAVPAGLAGGPGGVAAAAAGAVGGAGAAGGRSVSVVQQFYGPSTGTDRRRELEWTLRYAPITNTADRLAGTRRFAPAGG